MVQLQRRAGAGWEMVASRGVAVDPADTIAVIPLFVTAAGTDRVSFVDGNQVLGAADFTARHPGPAAP
ncbi:protein of unknown function [Candidatus Hydrogenisulfobacillus filiaventi]|uniref:Uncharacterized protein n=1 Tax=Candidatus Hydrogenisulfobacillus filiaventi TaxID=2707344 RepID=A0A6F8ZIU9_9FIRM|nr:protein of unknown function [Candidatus Hydrogenisulfobacillus filiaventi]